MKLVSGERREIKQQLAVVGKRRQRQGLQSDAAEGTPWCVTFPSIFWCCVSSRKVKQPGRRVL